MMGQPGINSPAAAHADRILTLDVTRSLATIFLILLHSCDVLLDGTDKVPSHWWFGVTLASLCICCVPLFIMCSGALLMNTEKALPIETFYRKRLPKLIIPFIFWSVAYFVSERPPSDITIKNIIMNTVTLFNGKSVKHLWFVYMLVGVYLSVPFLAFTFQKAPKNFLKYYIAFSFLLIFPNFVTSNFFNFLFFLPYSIFSVFLGYFVMGNQVYNPTGEYRISRQSMVLIMLIAYTGTVVATYLSHYHWKEFSYIFLNYESPNVIFFSIGLFMFLTSFSYKSLQPYAKYISLFSSTSYGIYLIHILIINGLRSGIFGFKLTPYVFDPFLGLPVSAMAVLAVSFVCVLLLKRIPVLRMVVP